MYKHKLAFAAIVKGTDEEAVILRKLLNNVSKHVDKVFITVTQPNEKVEATAKWFNAEVSHFKWRDDFAAARNFNFAQVPEEYDYIMWGDADDQFRNIPELRQAMDDNPVDGYSMNYLYAFDEFKNPTVVHPKTMVVRNDGCVEWAGRLHEDFKENRDVKILFVEGADRLHLTSDERVDENRERNLRIARKQAKDEPNDPRSYWNLGNSLKATNRNEESIVVFGRFLNTSQSDEEKYIVRLRRAESYWNIGERSKAIEEVEFAIGKKPDLPDAYNMKGKFYLNMDQFENAMEALLQGLTKRPQPLKIIVHNPRDYDYVPMMDLAKAYFALDLPSMAIVLLEACYKIYPKDTKLEKTLGTVKKEVVKFEDVTKLIGKLRKIKSDSRLKKKMDKIPEEYKSHPAVCQLRNTRFVKTESSGKDLVYYCGITKKEWNPDIAKTEGVGGSEEAVIHLSKLWSGAGYNVTVYNNCGPEEKVFDGVTYKPYWSWNFRDKQDITVLWRTPKPAEYDINSEKIYLDLHDVLAPGELTKNRLAKIDRIFVKSEFHRKIYPKLKRKSFVIVPNGIKPEDLQEDEERDQYLMINTSSADRSMSAVVEMFKEIKEAVPQAKLKWAYGWGIFDIVHATDSAVMEWKDNIIQEIEDTDGIESLGMISHGDVAKLYRTANVFLYPTEFAEIDCISITKAQAGGAVPVSTDFAALGGKTAHGDFVHSSKTKDNWALPYQYDFALQNKVKRKELVKMAIERLQNPMSEEDRNKMRSWAVDNYNWDKVSTVWLDEFTTK